MALPGLPDHSEWEERLQDWIDGELDPAAAAILDAHLTTCAICQSRRTALRAVDGTLARLIGQPRLDESFNRALLERASIEAQADQIAARARATQEQDRHLAALARQWRRSLGLLVLSVLAGTVLLGMLARSLAGAQELSRAFGQVTQLAQTPTGTPQWWLPQRWDTAWRSSGS